MTPNENQNTDEALLFQACARLFYNCATHLDIASWGINIVLPILKLLFPDNPTITTLLVLNFFLSIYSDSWIMKLTEKGADMKLMFDKLVFNFEYLANTKNQLIHEAMKKKRFKPAFFRKQMEKDGKSGGVKSWYSNLNDSLTNIDQYKESQKETSDYDERIGKLILIIFILLGFLFVWSIMIKNLTVNESLTLAFITFASLAKKMIQTWTKLKYEKSLLHKIDIYLSTNELSETESLDLLKLVNEKRRILLPIKGIIYPFLHEGIEKIWSKENIVE